MSIEEQYAPVAHKHYGCPVCEGIDLIQDVQPPRNEWDRLRITVRNMNVRFQIKQGKPIVWKEIQ